MAQRPMNIFGTGKITMHAVLVVKAMTMMAPQMLVTLLVITLLC